MRSSLYNPFVERKIGGGAVLKVTRLQNSSRIYLPVKVFSEFTGVERGEYYGKARLTLMCYDDGLALVIGEDIDGTPVTVHAKKLKTGGYIRYVTIPVVLYKMLGNRMYVPVEVRKGYMLLKVL
jgi:hypothetical protein